MNTDHFVIQKSTDGIAFLPAGSVKATGNEGGNTNYYRFTYSSVSNPSGFYRLQTADKNGSFTYSKVIRLQRITNAAITVFYNSSARQINIMNNSNTTCEWKLFSASGSAVKHGKSADRLIQINTSGIAPGVYIVSCSAAGKSVNTRMIIL